MAGWHHRLDGHEFEWTPGVGDGQGGLARCDSWGRKESDMTERLNWTELRPRDELNMQIDKDTSYCSTSAFATASPDSCRRTEGILVSFFCVIKPRGLATIFFMFMALHVGGFNQYSCAQVGLPLDWGLGSNLLPTFSRSWTKSYRNHVLFRVVCGNSRSKPDYTSTLNFSVPLMSLKICELKQVTGPSSASMGQENIFLLLWERYCKVTWQKQRCIIL